MAQRVRGAFSLLIVGASVAAGCGRQVTPNPPGLGPGGAPPGYLVFYFNTLATFNFSSYQYMFVVNTTGSGVTPSTDTVQTNWAGYSFALVARGNGVSSYAQFVQLVPPKAGKGPPGWVPLGTAPKLFSYNLNSNGSGTQFSLLVNRSVFAGIASPSPSPSPSASPTPTPPSKWTFNAFTTEPGGSQGVWEFLDSMGAGGPTDPQYVSPTLCMTEPFDQTFYATSGFVPPDPASQIVSVEIANNPVSPTPCP
jgi:hypothetical protein